MLKSYLVLIIILTGLTRIRNNPLWITYSKEEIHSDCFLVNLHYFCHQIEKSSVIASCKNGELWTFRMLNAIKATTDNLVDWLIPLNLIEQYAAYLENDGNTVLAVLAICNCTQNWVGRECDYGIIQESATPSKLLTVQISGRGQSTNEILTKLVDGTTCTSAHLFLEWRHICAGITQCQNGADELHCHLLEFHECEEDEFQCRNGMCIPIEFAFDAMPDCMDSSDEQENEEMNKKYYSCSLKASLDCDNRQCRKDQFSCGNGECIPWSSVFQSSKICSNHRQAAYNCDTMDYLKVFPDEPHGICRETMVNLSSLSNTSGCLESVGHLLRIRHDASLREVALNNIKERCEQLIVYSGKNAFFPGLYVVYNRSNIETFYQDLNNRKKPMPRIPDLYYFSGEIECDGVHFNISEKFWFDHQQIEQLASYPFFPLSHLLCQKLMNQSVSDTRAINTHPSSFSSPYYQCKNTSDRVSLRRINDGYIDCLYGDDERNPHYPMTQLFRYQCQTVTAPSQYVSYSKLGNDIDDCVDGSDEISKELHWSDFKCDLSDSYECWVFQGDRFNDNRIRDVRLHFHRYCDSVWDTMDGNDEKNCSKWICGPGLYQCNRTGQCIDRKYFCDGELDCGDGEDEVGCSPSKQLWNLEATCDNRTEYFCITQQYVKNQSSNRPCIPWSQVGDSHVDCIGARDERNVLPCPIDHRMVGDRFLCDNRTKCIDYPAICNGIKDCMDGTDESICYWNVGYCSTGHFSCADRRGCKSGRCKSKITCTDKSHRFWCPNASDDNVSYRPQKDRPIVDNKNRCYSQLYPQVNNMKASLPMTHQINYQSKEPSISYVYCNRGFYLIAASRSKLVCFCPPSFYGDRCQYDTRRVTIRIRFDRWHRFDLPLVLNVLFMLLLNNSQVIDHHFIADEAKEFPSKNDIYLVYPRPKPSGVYSVRIEAYHSTELIHFWEYSINPLDFLPVFRITKVLRFPDRSLPWLCSHNYCQNNGTCHQTEMNGSLCICPRHWKGKFCETKMDQILCSSRSLARTETVCVCPHGYMEPHCFIENLKCQRTKCNWNETCIPRSDPPIYKHMCICNTSDCKFDRPVIIFNRQEPNQSPFLVQLLQLSGNYPTVRHQILLRPSTSFPLMKTIRTRDRRTNIGPLPEIGLLFSFESHTNVVKSTLFLLFINCSDAVQNFTVDLDRQPQRCFTLPENERHHVALFPLFCRNEYYGTCFISDGYLCYCDYPYKNQSNCLSYQQKYTSCHYCQNQGHCVQGDLLNKTDFVCVCPKCVTGVLCQFLSTRFSISLEFLIEKTNWGRGHFIVPILLFVVGMIFNSLSIITFAQRKLRQNGVALHLLATSMCSFLVLMLLLGRITYLYMVRRIRIADGINTVVCKSLPMLMHTFYYVSLWLMALVTVERALAAVQYSRWSSLQERKKAITLVFVIISTVLGSNYIFISQYKLINHPNYSFPWCVREISPNQQLLTQLLALIHQAAPFAINIIAALIIILTITRSKVHAHRTTKHNTLFDQIYVHIDLLVGPLACFLAQLPEIVILFLNACNHDASDWFAPTTLCSYYISFVPQMSIFFLYVRSSRQYYDIFLKDTLLGKHLSTIFCNRRFFPPNEGLTKNEHGKGETNRSIFQ